jgi:hypothetical protein
MNIEESLERIKNKEEIISWIRNLPEDAIFVLLARERKEDSDINHYNYSDSITIAESNWLVDCFKYYLQTSTKL